jgi:pentatricopeptide repeat protein
VKKRSSIFSKDILAYYDTGNGYGLVSLFRDYRSDKLCNTQCRRICMYPFLKQAQGPHRTSLSYYSNLIDHCLSLKSLNFANAIHAQLIKVGFDSHTFLGNRCLDLYSQFGTVNDALKVFDGISDRNCISWNVCLKAVLGHGQVERAGRLFDEMPVRDVVTWNTMISGYFSCGFVDYALKTFIEMQNAGVRPSGFTLSILLSPVSCARHGKQIHGFMIRHGLNLSNLVLGNSLIDMYGKLGLVDYAFGVFLTMEKVDIISWNSLILVCHRSGYRELALDQFCLMRTTEHSPDQFTVSTVISVCSDLHDLEKGKQVFAFCIKVGFNSNSIVSSAVIDMFSKCNRLEDSVQLFEELGQWDSALSNSMIPSYAAHGFVEDALQLFVLTLRENLMPTEFTLSSVLSAVSTFHPPEQGSQIHSLVIKVGYESDSVVANSLVEMYAKVGLINFSMKIFTDMGVRDLISWNTIIWGLTNNGRVYETLDIFKELIQEGPPPDRITLAGVLLACKYGRFVDDGMIIFSSMEKEYGVLPGDEHYACVVELFSQAGKLKEAMDIIHAMPNEPSCIMWGSILCASLIHGDLKLTERVAERMMELEPQSSLPYLVLARAYEMRGRWESMVRVRKSIEHKVVKKVTGCSWIWIKNRVHMFKTNKLQHHGGREIYFVLRLLIWEIEDKGYF